MKCIVKSEEPAELIAFKAAATDDWRPSYDNLTSEVKSALKHSLMKEQGWICCYCESRIRERDSHIEHLRPRNSTAHDTDDLDYSNMLCSCQQRLEPREPRHCGVAKGDWYSPDLLVSPLDPSCESRFLFGGNGAIEARPDDAGARETIAKLKLDLPKLRALRSAAIQAIVDLNPGDIALFLQRDSQGMYPPYYVTIRQVLGG